MSAIGHYLETEGIPSASISLVREHSEAMRPPRALWVPFMLGRPLGAPDNPAFQRKVLRAVLALFEAPSGPVLRDFPEDAPVSAIAADDEEGAACPVNFRRPSQPTEGSHALAQALHEEIAQLQPWHDLAVRRRAGTTAALSALAPEQIADFLVAFASDAAPANYHPELSMGEALRMAAEDLRAFYEEAAGAQPGELSAASMIDWFYMQTVAGEVLQKAYRIARTSADASVRAAAERRLIPRTILRRIAG